MRRRIVWVLVLALLLAGGLAWAQKAKVTFFWALYDGLTEDYRHSLQDAFMAANPTIDVDIVPIAWELMQEKMSTSVAGGQPPELCVIGTRWLLDLMSTDSVLEVDKVVSKATLSNIAAGAMEANIKGKLMGLPDRRGRAHPGHQQRHHQGGAQDHGGAARRGQDGSTSRRRSTA